MKTNSIALIATLFISFIFIMSSSFSEDTVPLCKNNQIISHSGGTDKCGCHYNRKTGRYHCHTRKQRGGDCPA